jgi:hypothetical protein
VYFSFSESILQFNAAFFLFQQVCKKTFVKINTRNLCENPKPNKADFLPLTRTGVKKSFPNKNKTAIERLKMCRIYDIFVSHQSQLILKCYLLIGYIELWE